jgi:hypothetical protein
MKRDAYSVIGVGHDASPAEIDHAYRVLVRETHPDHATGPLDLARRTKITIELNTAVGILRDPLTRRHLDRELASARRSESAAPQSKQASTPADDAAISEEMRQTLDRLRQQREQREADARAYAKAGAPQGSHARAAGAAATASERPVKSNTPRSDTSFTAAVATAKSFAIAAVLTVALAVLSGITSPNDRLGFTANILLVWLIIEPFLTRSLRNPAGVLLRFAGSFFGRRADGMIAHNARLRGHTSAAG